MALPELLLALLGLGVLISVMDISATKNKSTNIALNFGMSLSLLSAVTIVPCAFPGLSAHRQLGRLAAEIDGVKICQPRNGEILVAITCIPALPRLFVRVSSAVVRPSCASHPPWQEQTHVSVVGQWTINRRRGSAPVCAPQKQPPSFRLGGWIV